MADEKTGPDSVRVFLTGAGADNGAQADPDASLGNFRSSSLVDFLGVTVTNPFANVTIDFVSGSNGVGDGTLTASGASELKYTPPGGVQGAGVAIADGETKMIQGDDLDKFVIVSRTSADALTGTATLTLVNQFNSALGFDNVSTAEAAAGDTEYRCVCFKNVSAVEIQNLEVRLGELGTSQVTDGDQLGAAGAGSIETTGSFSDAPNRGYAQVKTNAGVIREVVYYSSRTATILTVPATGRELLGSTAAAGAANDTVHFISGWNIAKEAPNAQPAGFFTDKTGAGEGAQPGGLDWVHGITYAQGLDIGDLDTLEQYAVWFEREIPEAAIADASMANYIQWRYDAA